VTGRLLKVMIIAEGDDHCCNKVDATDICVHWTGQDAVG
jgi:hypothetical protein